MTPERWKELKNLLNEALDVPPSERARFLEETSVDEELVREVESLLAMETQVGDFIERPALETASSGADSGDRAGQRVGPYQLVEEIGRGGMGTVYRAVRADDTFDKTVAVKVLKRGLDTDEVVRRFRAERQILAGLDHPNIARLLDGGTTEDGLPYLVMEYVEGIPIDLYCREEELSVEERLDLFLQVCSAAQLAHRNLVVHRDLKPSNILVTEDGIPKLLDFGIAKLLDPNLAEGLVTLRGWQFLTPEYASPEQIEGAPITTAADVYSLGVLLYQLLADRRPYDLADRSSDGLARALQAGEPSRPSTVAPTERAARIRGDLDNIVLMALRREPERRYSTVEQLADDLDRHRDARPVRATPNSLGYRVGKFIRRNKLPVSVGAAFVALAVTFSLVAFALAEEAAENAVEAEAISDFLIEILKTRDPDVGQGEELTVREAFEDARERLENEEEFKDQPERKALFLQKIADVYLAQGWWEEAKEVLPQVIELRESIFGENSLVLTSSLNALAEAHFQTDELSRGAELLDRALDIEIRHSGPSDAEVLKSRTNLATIHRRLQRPSVEGEFHELVEAWRTQENQEELAGVLHNLGVYLSSRGRYTEAEVPLREALALRRDLDSTTDLGKTTEELAWVLHGMGETRQAESYLRDKVRSDAQVFEKGSPRRLDAMNKLALLLQSRGELAEAEALLESLIAETGAGLRRAVFHRNLASVKLDRGDLETAAEHLSVALGYWDEDKQDSPHALYARSILGSLRTAQGRYPEAEQILLDSYSGLRDDPWLTDQHLDVRDTRRRLAELYEAWDRPEMAERYRTEPARPGAEGSPRGAAATTPTD